MKGMPSKFVIYLLGTSNTGKSTLEKILKERLPGMYSVSYDALKWQLAGYDREKHIPLISEITLELFKTVLRQGIPVLLVARFENEKGYLRYKRSEQENGYSSLSIELTAPKDVLLERFRKRVADARQSNSKKVSIMDEEVFLKNLEKKWFVPLDTLAFDTSVIKAENIADGIIDRLRSLK